MQKALRVAHLILLLAGAFLCTSIGVLALRGLSSVKKLDLDLDEAHRVLLEAGLTASSARQASAKEVAYLDQWNAGLGRTLSNLNALLASSKKTVDEAGKSEAELVQASEETLASTRGAITGLQPVEAGTAAELAALKQSTTDLDALIADPDIQKTIASFEVSSDNAAVISTDARQVVEKYAHPSKKKLGFWGGLWAAVKIVHEFEPPIF